MAGVSRTNSNSSKRKSRVVACSNCRRQKTRCEVLEVKNQATVRCHRCKTLDLTCSYEDMDKGLFEARVTRTEDHLATEAPILSTSTSPAPSSKSTDEVILELESMFQDLKIIQPTSAKEAIPAATENVKTMGVEALPRRIRLWFSTFYHSCSYDRYADVFQDVNPAPDWSAPLACVRNLHPKESSSDAFRPMNGVPASGSLESLLAKDQIDRLLDTFNQQYAPFLCFNTTHASSRSPILRLICCTVVASRHHHNKNGDLRNMVINKLRTVAEEMITKILYNLQLFCSVETVKALFIMALWPQPSYGDEAVGKGDFSPHYMITCAITMARNLRLHECVDKAFALRQSEVAHPGLGEGIDTAYFADMMDRARLWTSLMNIDSLFSLEQGHQCRPANHGGRFASLFPLPNMVPSGAESCQDIRLRLLGGTVQIAANTLSSPLSSFQSKDVDVFFRRQRNSVRDLNEMHRLVAPLRVLAPCDAFYFQMLSIVCRSCQLMVYYNTLRTGRKIYENSPHPNPDFPLWYMHIKTYDLVLNFWGKDARSLAESILISILDADSALLGTAPDYLFLHVAFTATYIIGLKFVSLNGLNAITSGVECALLAKVVERLHHAAKHHPDHPAERCAHFIRGLLSLWEHRDVLFRPSDEDDMPILNLSGT
ncbi:hypothetical protein WG66_006777 [Moniliophthora roreri]|nr:hypothetical protein WG66_006777 [Moniliophthora roreri]